MSAAEDVARAFDLQIAQQIGVDLVAGRGLGRARLRPQRFDPHPAHQAPDTLAIDREAVLAKRFGDPPRAEEGPLGEQRIDPPHRLEVVVVGRRRAVHARAREVHHLALPPDRQVGMRLVELGSAIRRAHLPNLLAKKSFSIVSCPILA